MPFLSASFEEDIVNFGPGNLAIFTNRIINTIKKGIERAENDADNSNIYLLKLSGWDSDVFFKISDSLRRSVEYAQASVKQANSEDQAKLFHVGEVKLLAAGLDAVIENYFQVNIAQIMLPATLPSADPDTLFSCSQVDRSVDVHFIVANLFGLMGNFAKALTLYEASERIFGPTVNKSRQRTTCLLNLGRFEDALAAMESALELAKAGTGNSAEKLLFEVQEARDKIASSLGL